jgi:hypothetical protein
MGELERITYLNHSITSLCRPCPPTTTPTPPFTTFTLGATTELSPIAAPASARRWAGVDVEHPPLGRRRSPPPAPGGYGGATALRGVDIIAILGLTSSPGMTRSPSPGPQDPAVPLAAVLRGRCSPAYPASFRSRDGQSFEALVNGRLDGAGEAFFNVGGAEGVLAKAKSLQES